MPSPEELFHHIYHDGIRDLELTRAENELEINAAEASGNLNQAHKIMLKQYGVMIDDVIKKLKLERVDPESVVRNG